MTAPLPPGGSSAWSPLSATSSMSPPPARRRRRLAPPYSQQQKPQIDGSKKMVVPAKSITGSSKKEPIAARGSKNSICFQQKTLPVPAKITAGASKNDFDVRLVPAQIDVVAAPPARDAASPANACNTSTSRFQHLRRVVAVPPVTDAAFTRNGCSFADNGCSTAQTVLAPPSIGCKL